MIDKFINTDKTLWSATEEVRYHKLQAHGVSDSFAQSTGNFATFHAVPVGWS